VFTTGVGTPLEPSYVSRLFVELCAEHGSAGSASTTCATPT
jgi:hypothetical protein